MHIRILGSAAGGGFPQWNCNCVNCQGYRRGNTRMRARSQSSIAVSANGTDWALVNCSPDIRSQMEAFPPLRDERVARGTNVRGILLVDAQLDHATGLALLREGAPLNIYGTREVRDELSTAFPLVTVLQTYCGVKWTEFSADPRASFTVRGVEGLRFTAIASGGEAPPYSARRGNPRPGDAVALWIQDAASGRSALYAPGLGRASLSLTEAMRRSNCLIVDGTVWSNNELIAMGLGARTASDMGHLPLSGESGMLALLREFPAKRRVLTHINNTNPILNEDSEEYLSVLRDGIEVAYDGMDIVI